MLSFSVSINSAQAITIGSNVYFILSSYSTYIDFTSNIDFTEITVDNGYVLFDSYRLIVENGNVTFTNWFNDDTLQFSTSWTTGGKTTILMNGSSPIQTPYKITYLGNQPAWYWLGENNTLKLEVANPETIEIFWLGEDDKPPPSPWNPIIVPRQPQTPFVFPYATYIPYICFGILAIAFLSAITISRKHGRRHKNIKFRFPTYSPHTKKVNLSIKKSKDVKLRVKKKKTPKIKKHDLYD